MVLQKDMAERTPQDKLLLFVDAYDVLVVGDQKQIVERFFFEESCERIFFMSSSNH